MKYYTDSSVAEIKDRIALSTKPMTSEWPTTSGGIYSMEAGDKVKIINRGNLPNHLQRFLIVEFCETTGGSYVQGRFIRGAYCKLAIATMYIVLSTFLILAFSSFELHMSKASFVAPIAIGYVVVTLASGIPHLFHKKLESKTLLVLESCLTSFRRVDSENGSIVRMTP